jgi:threonine aldolase
MQSHSFGSDNHAPIHPLILQSIIEHNQGHTPSYGTDLVTQKVTAQIKTLFGKQAQPYFVFNGTAANVLALKSFLKSGQSLLCADVSHLHVDESAAPEFFTQSKLVAVKTTQGKISVSALEEHFIRRGDIHFAQVVGLSLTQPTELGTVYSFEELKEIISWAKKKSLFIHIDGARLANAAVSLRLDFAKWTTDLGVDVISLGGTKNGLLGGEIILFLNPSLVHHFEVFRKQSGQLPSKTRYLAAQFFAYFNNALWEDIAKNSLHMAQNLHVGAKTISQVEIIYETQSNAVFAKIPQPWVKKIRDKHFFYVWDEKTWLCRWMTSWDTKTQDINAFISHIKEVANEASTRSLS